jgi:hypothetical protein
MNKITAPIPKKRMSSMMSSGRPIPNISLPLRGLLREKPVMDNFTLELVWGQEKLLFKVIDMHVKKLVQLTRLYLSIKLPRNSI